jgi:L-2-hydroxyglutarate oxidase
MNISQETTMSSSKTYDIAIIGGGIVGMATAMELSSRPKLSVLVVEAENRLAAHQTGNNSGVIHSGLYYKPGSLKASNCTQGRELLYQFCEKHQIPAERCGKVVIATRKDELGRMQDLKERGTANGLKGLKSLTPDEIKKYEPHVAGIAGLFVPDTGIVDYTRVTEKFSDIFRSNGGEVKLNTRVKKIKRMRNEIILYSENETISCKNLINCAGLQSDRVARLCGINPGLKIIPFRGEYYELVKEKEYLIRNLVYPVPDPQFPFLGVHFTRMIAGGVEAGPNAVLALKREGYKKTSFSLKDLTETIFYRGFWIMISRHWKMGMGEQYRSLVKSAFVRALQRLLPEISKKDLKAGGAGVRAQALEPNGFLVDDFRIKEEKNMVHVLNAPSPAATASINIGRTISKIAFKNFNL